MSQSVLGKTMEELKQMTLGLDCDLSYYPEPCGGKLRDCDFIRDVSQICDAHRVIFIKDQLEQLPSCMKGKPCANCWCHKGYHADLDGGYSDCSNCVVCGRYEDTLTDTKSKIKKYIQRLKAMVEI